MKLPTRARTGGDKPAPVRLVDVCEEYEKRNCPLEMSLLAEEGVETRIEPSDHIVAVTTGVRLMVEADMVHRAKWILKRNDFSYEELNFLTR